MRARCTVDAHLVTARADSGTGDAHARSAVEGCGAKVLRHERAREWRRGKPLAGLQGTVSARQAADFAQENRPFTPRAV